jgi:hypothetical protein
VCEWKCQAKVAKILENLRGRVLASLDSIAVLRVMVERRVLPLKRWVHLLCDYIGAKDPTHEAMEELKDDAIMECLAGLVDAGVVV